MRRTRAGFTLLEMLVAIAIFASLALMAQQVTNGVTRVNSAVADHDQKLNLMQQTMSFLTHDLTQMMPRPVRGDQGQREPALLAGAGVLASESEGMRFVRGGVVNPLMRMPRSNLLTVGYRIHDGYLERLSWPLTDAASAASDVYKRQEADNAKVDSGRFAPFAVLRRHALAGELVVSTGDPCGSAHDSAFAAMGRD